MSDQDLGKKLIEWVHLNRFLDAYEHVTGRTLLPVGSGESPDFVVRRPTGSRAGLELVQVYLEPPGQFDYAPNLHSDWMQGFNAARAVSRAISGKAEKLQKDHWRYRKQTILVVTLMDVPLAEVAPFLDPSLQREFAAHGFVEVWVADLTPDDMDAYDGDIRLFGLHPKKWWGLHERRHPFRKLYG